MTSMTMIQSTQTVNIDMHGTMIISIAGSNFELSGRIYHSDDQTHMQLKYGKPLAEQIESISLGTIGSIIVDVDRVLLNINHKPGEDPTSGLAGLWKSMEKTVSPTSFLGEIIKAIKNTEIYITYLEIDTKAKKYGFGFGLSFNKPLRLGNIEITASSLVLQYDSQVEKMLLSSYPAPYNGEFIQVKPAYAG